MRKFKINLLWTKLGNNKWTYSAINSHHGQILPRFERF